MNSVIITGATGMIGIGLIEHCIKHRMKVVAVVRENSENISRIPISEYVEVVECNLNNLSSLKSLSGIYDTFYHFGWDGTYGNARNDVSIQLKNIEYTLEAVKVAKELGCKRFVGSGSQAENGFVENILNENTLANPQIPYGIGKYSAGKMSRILCQQLGMQHIWTRVFSVFSPYDHKNTMVRYAIETLLKGEIPEFTKAEQNWNYLYYKDAGKAFFLLGEKGRDGETYCVASRTTSLLKSYIERIRDCVNADMPLGIGVKPYPANISMHISVDVSKIVKEIGFVEEYSFEDGILDIVKHGYGK